MNKDRMNAVLDAIEANPEHFDWGTWGRNLTLAKLTDDDLLEPSEGVPSYYRRLENERCGTLACVAGWACALRDHELGEESDIHPGNASQIAAEWLELDRHQANQLFFGDLVDEYGERLNVTINSPAAEAVAAIRLWMTLQED